jgi:MFS family permease
MGQPTAAQRPLLTELHRYYLLVGTYFFAFGLQFVLFPSLVAFVLAEPADKVGLAQMAISTPMFAFLLVGGLIAERARAGPSLALLQLAFAAASFGLAFIVRGGWLTYQGLIIYAVGVGSFAAFVQPMRDSALNGVLAREAASGRVTTIARAAATATAVQIGAQIAGILVARLAGAAPAPFLALQGGVLGLAALIALTLTTPRQPGRAHTIRSAFTDVGDGLRYAFGDAVMGPMLISAAFVGVFVVGTFQVLFPLFIREVYGGDASAQAERLSILFASFWAASFVSAVILSRSKPIRRPGRAMLASHLAGALVILSFVFEKPFWAFTAVVACWGFVAGVAISMSRTIVQGAAAEAYLGRVLAVYSMGFMGGAPIGSALIGFGADHFGPRLVSLAPGVGLLVAASVLAATTPLWKLQLPSAADVRS